MTTIEERIQAHQETYPDQTLPSWLLSHAVDADAEIADLRERVAVFRDRTSMRIELDLQDRAAVLHCPLRDDRRGRCNARGCTCNPFDNEDGEEGAPDACPLREGHAEIAEWEKCSPEIEGA